MTQTIEFEGTAHEFPDDFTPQEIQRALEMAHPVPTVIQPSPENTPHTALQKLSQGAGDMALGAEQFLSRFGPMGPSYIPASGLPGGAMTQGQRAAITAPLTADMTQRENQWQNERKASGDTGTEWIRGAGRFAATAPVLALMPSMGTSLAGAIGTGAVQGALSSAAEPVYGNGDYTSQKLKQMGVGTAFGGIGGGILKGVGSAINPQISSDARTLINEGVPLTFGQAIGPKAAKTEEMLTSVPGLGDLIKDSQRSATEGFNRAIYNRVLSPIGEKIDGDVGHSAVRQVGDRLSSAYDEIVPSLKLVPDEQLSTDLASAASHKQMMSDEAAKQFDRILEAKMPKGPMEGEGLKKLEEQLTFEIGRFGKSPDPNHQMVSDALSDVRSAVMDNLARTNPEQAERLSAINQGWAGLVRLERAAANSKDGVFTPEGFLSAVKATDQSTRSRAFARGQSFMQDIGTAGYNVLGKKYPDSGSPGRALASAAALGYLNPKALAGGAVASIPYLPGVRNVAYKAVSARPSFAPGLENFLLSGGMPTYNAILGARRE